MDTVGGAATAPRVVLCVDDDPVSQSWIAATMGDAGEWEVRGARSLEEAASHYLHAPADVVLLDLGLGQRSGDTTDDGAARVSDVLAWQPRPAVVVLTSEMSARLAAEAIDRGAQDYLDKRRFTTPVVTRVLDYAHRRHLATLRAAAPDTGAEREDEFAASVGTLWHDLRAPLATMVSLAEATRQLARLDDMPRDTVHELATRTVNLGRRALWFTDEVLRDVEEGDTARAALDLDTLAREAWSLLDTGNVTLRVDVAVEGIYGIRGPMRQVLVNLFGNALRYVPSVGGHVMVDAVVHGAAVRVRIHDNGPGVPVAERTTIFRRGVSDGSSGLGLATVERQMARQGGRAWVVDSHQLGGAMFVLELPHRQADRHGPVPEV